MNKKSKLLLMTLAVSIAVVSANVAEISSLAAGKAGTSTVNNVLKTSKGTDVLTTIQTNYHAGTILGLAGISTADTFKQAVGLTKEELDGGGYPVLYVADSDCGPLAQKSINDVAVDVGGNVVSIVEIMLFKFASEWNQPISVTNVPVTLTVGIPKSALASSREYGMVRLHDGQTTLLRDLDTDPNTVTFETDRFSVYALIYAEKGSFDYYEANAASPATTTTNTASADTTTVNAAAVTASDDDWDDVPKTGEASPIPYAITAIILAAGGIFVVNRRYAR